MLGKSIEFTSGTLTHIGIIVGGHPDYIRTIRKEKMLLFVCQLVYLNVWFLQVDSDVFDIDPPPEPKMECVNIMPLVDLLIRSTHMAGFITLSVNHTPSPKNGIERV